MKTLKEIKEMAPGELQDRDFELFKKFFEIKIRDIVEFADDNHIPFEIFIIETLKVANALSEEYAKYVMRIGSEPSEKELSYIG